MSVLGLRYWKVELTPFGHIAYGSTAEYEENHFEIVPIKVKLIGDGENTTEIIYGMSPMFLNEGDEEVIICDYHISTGTRTKIGFGDGFRDKVYAFNVTSYSNDSVAEWLEANTEEVKSVTLKSNMSAFGDITDDITYELLVDFANLSHIKTYTRTTVTAEGETVELTITGLYPAMYFNGELSVFYYFEELQVWIPVNPITWEANFEGLTFAVPNELNIAGYYFTSGTGQEFIDNSKAQYDEWLIANTEADVISSLVTIEYNGSTIAELNAGETATLKCKDLPMETDVVVKVNEGAGGGSGECSGGCIIEVEELPTENIDTNAIYNYNNSYYKYSNIFNDVIMYDTDNGATSFVDMASAEGMVVELYHVPTKPTENIKELSPPLYPLYYVEDENNIFINMGSWFSFGELMSLPYMGAITNKNQATEVGYYALMGAWENYVAVKGNLHIQENNSFDVSDKVSVSVQVPTTYIGYKTTDELPTNAPEGSLAIVASSGTIGAGIDIPKQWGGWNNFSGEDVWTDGTNTYCSYYKYFHLVLNGDTWEAKTWNGLTEWYGRYVWTDGTNIYYSDNAKQYVLNKETSTWETKVWGGTNTFGANYIWSDGTNIYLGSSWVLNKETSTWETKTWNGLTEFYGDYIWTDGTNIYYSYCYDYSDQDNKQYVLNKETSTWEAKAWGGLTKFSGRGVWTDGTNIYLVYFGDYVLNKETSTWETKKWNANIYAEAVWTDGKHTYHAHYQYPSHNCMILPSADICICQKDGSWAAVGSITKQ